MVAMIQVKYEHRYEFWCWCRDNDILCEYMGSLSGTSMDMWYIGREQDRIQAILRWV